MKNLFQKSLLVLIGVLITSFTTQVWAGPTINGGTFYFDDSGYDWSTVYMCVGNDSYTTVYGMSNISNTKLWYYNMSSYGSPTYIRFIACNWGSGYWGPSNYNCSYGYTNIYGATYTFNSNSLYLFTTSGTNYGADVYVAYQSAYSNLNKTIQVKAKVSTDNGGSYSETTSPATLSASSKRFSNYNTCGTTTSLSNGSITCGYTATTTLTAPSTDPTGYTFVGWYDSGGTQKTTSKTLTIYPTGDATYYAYYKKLYTISAGTTIIWDLGKNDANSGDASWSSAYLYKDVDGTGTSNDALTQCGSSTQYVKTYANAVSKIKVFLFREVNTGTWNTYKQTTDLYRDVSGVTLFTYCNSTTDSDNKKKLDWQVTTNAKKATSGRKIYFDNTNVSSWTNIYLKYGTNWSGGGFNRATSKATKVTGTSNLYYITIPNDVYYKEYFLSNAAGSTGYYDIETMTSISARTAYQPYNFAADSTLIANTGTGTGTSGNPKVWSVTKMAGHTHSVTITAPSHGTITVGYTNESGTAQSPTSGSFNVARTCSLTVSSSAATGYKPSTLTINESAHTSGNVYIIRGNITVAATFTPKSCSVTFDKEGGAEGDDGITATYDADLETIDIPNKDGYTFGGYWDGDDGTGTQYYNADGTSARAWDKNTESETTLYAKWDEITHTVSFANDGNGSTSPNSDQTVGVVTGVNISVTPNTGYEFNTWTSSNGGTFTSAATTASNTFKPTAGDDTLTASFNAKQYDITLDDNGEYDGDGSAKVTYNETSLTSISAPTRDGYEVDYYALYSNGNDKVASPTGELEKGLTGYLSGDGKWIHDDDVTLYTIWKPRSYTITLDRQGGTAGPTSFTVTMNDNNYSPLTVQPTRAGYHFEGYFTEPLGEGTQIFDENGEALANVSGYTTTYSKWINTSDDLELYAYWTEVALTFNGSTDDDWATASNWSPACVPTSGHDVTISAEATISGSAVAKSVTIDEEGTLIIASTGALEVAGAVVNSDDAKLVVEPSGALIYSGSTNATVEMSMSTGWHLVALPVAGVSVSSAFAGKGVYTYAWGNTTKAWERRGYYDDLMANEAVLVMGSTGYTFTGALVSTGDGGGSLGYDDKKANGDVNMFGNSLTAPIKVSGMTITGSPDGSVHVFNGSGWTGLISGDVIPAMQGYAILASSGGGSFSYSYATAVRGATNPNAALYAPKRTADDILDHISIYVSDNEWKTRIRLCENEQFTDEMDLGYEALHMEGEGFAGELYAQAAEKMNILAVPDLEGTVVGFIKGEATDYTISFEGDGKGYYLNDIEEQQSTLITEDNTYMFTPSENDAARFIISKTPIKHVATGVDEVNDGVIARKQMINGILYIIRDGRLYDAQGALVK